MRHREGWQAAGMRYPELYILSGLLIVLAIAGGASRAGEWGQLFVRVAAILAMLALTVTRRQRNWQSVRLPLILLGLVAGIAALQLVPLPPALWTMMPGRAPFMAAVPIGPQPWRPINLTPDEGLNTLLSLSVPLAILVTLASVPAARRATVVDIMLGMIISSALVGSIELAGGGFASPFINNTPGDASGLFANRNHQALLLALGLPLLAVRAFRSTDRRMRPMAWALAIALAVWLLMLILATGSRAGLALAGLGLMSSVIIVWRSLKRTGLRLPRWALPAFIGAIGAVIALVVFVGMASDRAQSLTRLAASGEAGDIRVSSLPLLRNLIGSYFPFGSGFGSFDPVFRIIEPFDLLAPTYFNHAHNEVIELLIETGIAGAAIIGYLLFAWAYLGRSCWRSLRSGSAIGFASWSALTMIAVASLVDYPARTPIIMAIAMLCAWLARPIENDAALPS